MTTFPNHVYSVDFWRHENETYVFASGDKAGLDVFRLSDLDQSGLTSKWIYSGVFNIKRLLFMCVVT